MEINLKNLSMLNIMVRRNPRAFVLLIRVAIEQTKLDNPYSDFVPLDKFPTFPFHYFTYLISKEQLEISTKGVRITNDWLSIIPIT